MEKTKRAPRIDRAKRDVAAKLLRDFVAGRITNDALDDGWPLGRGDPALNEVFLGFVWGCYDDLHTHMFDGRPEVARELEKCAAFLESDEPYVWPVRNPLLELLLVPLSLITLGQLNFRRERESWWPFPSDESLQRHDRVR